MAGKGEIVKFNVGEARIKTTRVSFFCMIASSPPHGALFEGVVVVQCKTLIIYSVLCEIASEIATLRMLYMPCTQGQICPKSPTFGGCKYSIWTWKGS